MFFKDEPHFPQMISFVNLFAKEFTMTRNNLKIETIDLKDITFLEYCEILIKQFKLKAFIMGERYIDNQVGKLIRTRINPL